MTDPAIAHELDPRTLPEAERLESLRRGLDAIHARVQAEMGDEDVRHVRRLHAFSRACEVAGRLMIHFSVEPVTWTAGVLTLWLHKQLQATEIGHPVLHGSYDKLDGAEAFRSTTWTWHIPIDEASWHRGHNLRHHPYTNVAHRDPDIAFGPVRLNAHTPHRWFHYGQVPFTLLFMWPSFAYGMNLHFTGITDLFKAQDRDFLPDRSWTSVKGALGAAMRKFVPYYGKEFVLFPLLAGPFWWKVAAANLLTEWMRDVYSAASIFCGHVGPGLDGHAKDTQARGRAAWYAMQLQETQNYEVPYLVSVLCGGLDRQIEHHLFPKLPPERLRQIAPEVRALCEAHGVAYRTGSWPGVLLRSFQRLWELSFPEPTPSSASLATASP